VELVGGEPEPARVAPDLREADELGPAVEGRVLDPLRRHRPAHLLEADDQLGPGLLVDPPRGADLASEHEVDDHVEGLVEVGVEALAGVGGGLPHEVLGLARGCLAGHHVRPVAVHRDDQFHQ